MGFVIRHGTLLLSYVLLATVGVFLGHGMATRSNTQTDPHAFTIASSIVSGISPGKPLTFAVVVSNPSAQAMKLLTLSTTVTLQPAPRASGPSAPTCEVSKLTVAAYNSATRGAPQYVVPGRGTATVPLTITLADTSTNQDGCKNRKFTLTYAGTAEQAH